MILFKATAPTTLTDDSITQVPSSDAPTICTVDFAEYVETARLSREEQRAARQGSAGDLFRRHDLAWREQISSALRTLQQWSWASVWQVRHLGSPSSWTGVRTRRSSFSNSNHGTNRTASWVAIFLLINCACNGATSTIPSFPELGFGLAISLELAMAAASYFASWSLWQVFVGLDSFQYPIKTYGDLAERIYGKWAGRFVLAVQSTDIFLATGMNMMAGAFWLYWVTANLGTAQVCYSVLCLSVTLCAICLTEIRPLASFKWIACLGFLITVVQFGMSVVASTWVDATLNYAQAVTPPTSSLEPIGRTFGYPGRSTYDFEEVPLWAAALRRISASYWGNTVFTEFMAEMEVVDDFRSALRWAWLWFVVQRVLLGMLFYAEQGQYSALNLFSLETVATEGSVSGSVLATFYFLRALNETIQCALQANVALKVILRGTLNKVRSVTIWNVRRVAIVWTIVVPTYWIASYLVAMCLPLYGILSEIYFSIGWGFTAYGLPPILYLGFCARMYAFVPSASGQATRRGAVDLEPGNLWLSNPTMQRARVVVAVLVIPIAFVVSGLSMWPTVLIILQDIRNGFWKPNIASCDAYR